MKRTSAMPLPGTSSTVTPWPVPDGRGFWGGWGPLPGPWLEPGFHERGFLDLPLNTGVMGDLIDHFNDMLRDLAATSTAPLVYVDVRGALRNDLTNQVYREDWDNELHPKRKASRPSRG